MTGLPDDYFIYSHRQRGLDHGFYPHRNLAEAPRVSWPGGKKLALWVAVHVGHFPLDMSSKPIPVPGGMERPYPSCWDYTQRDYGNRVGIYRLLRALTVRHIPATELTSAVLATRYPSLLCHMREAGWEVAAAGLDKGRVHHAGMPEAEERAMVEEAMALLGRPAGWHSPAHSESLNTLGLVAAAGARYVADWVNDDLPYRVTTPSGPLLALPLNWDLSDQRVLFQQHMATEEYCDAVRAARDQLLAEAVTVGAWARALPHHHALGDGPPAPHGGVRGAAR